MARFPGDDVVLLRDVSWREFEHRLALKGEQATPRMHYLDGVLELMTPSRGHERNGSWIGMLIGIYALDTGIELSSFGHWTLTDKLRRAGAEADDCYILGDDSDEKLTHPHFVIEINWSRRGIKKLEIYRRLGVREVWFWERGAVSIHVLRTGKWIQVPRSECLPDLDLDVLCRCLQRPTMTNAMRDFRDHVRLSRRS
jgi:Uma2 family endonuclease